ncbi:MULTISPECIES: hypothetical protein [unclassified Streptomyces]|uniref:hypothetical protein n=1 Tax=unclassified Streptomyces TaxID=2593676 RepID=UPI002DD9E4A5|nr:MULTISPECIES: hypothetical protein [unclassified Streptomyces]WSF90327.1 hypothetical protein OIE70_04335 [Streptomyces sp. NBC_01744]WSC42535.1 hypothetical protein OHA08_40745 [Streptomyces sp. NBC_01763]WSC50884.1 hypothetical protein OIE61_40465 [Streptomyces sp. NBC_01762]WSC59193.1 hypothetical protein OG808_04195 [Streptomyces sp. NBC_01761]WSD30499.1 hypothetical protein OHA26_40815 [Streptomyces sp. NBC_01751]
MSTPPPSEGLSLAAVAPIVETRVLVDTVEISTEASTWEICRSTRLMERVTV